MLDKAKPDAILIRKEKFNLPCGANRNEHERPTPIDVYDSAVMTAIVELSGISIERNMPVPFPDFTKGKWQTNKPYFAMD